MNTVLSTKSSMKPIFAFSGRVVSDLSWAALGGMSSIVFAYADQIFHVAGTITVWLILLGRFALWWGLVVVGRIYGLRFTIRGAILLMVANVASLVATFSTGFVHSFSNWLVGIFIAIGILIAFVDLWALRQTTHRILVSVIVVGFVGMRFLWASEWLPVEWLNFLDSINIGLIAWLFYVVIDQLNSEESTVPSSTSGDELTL